MSAMKNFITLVALLSTAACAPTKTAAAPAPVVVGDAPEITEYDLDESSMAEVGRDLAPDLRAVCQQNVIDVWVDRDQCGVTCELSENPGCNGTTRHGVENPHCAARYYERVSAIEDCFEKCVQPLQWPTCMAEFDIKQPQ